MVGLRRRKPHFLLVPCQHRATFGAQKEILVLGAPDVFNLSNLSKGPLADCVKLCHKLIMQRQSSFKFDQDLYGLDQDVAAVLLLWVAVALQTDRLSL